MKTLRGNPRTWWVWPGCFMVLAVVVLRGAILDSPALYDPSEGRYALISLNMFESGEWVFPQVLMHEKLVPYWSKPPLHFWLTAASLNLAGVSEGSCRIPSFASGVLMLGMVFLLAMRIWGAEVAVLSVLVLSSSVLFFILMGSAILDVTLSAAVTGALVSLALFIHEEQGTRRTMAGLAFFVFMALGVLVKGPVSAVLSVVPAVIWLTSVRKWERLRGFPWIGGLLVFCVLVVPWYAVAQVATPGIIKYQLFNENILRFLVKDYGDLYGGGHRHPYGAIWLMLGVFFMPWTLVGLVPLLKSWRWGVLPNDDPNRSWFRYCLVWGLTPPLIFTFSPQWLVTYLLPGFGGLAIAAAVIMEKGMNLPGWRWRGRIVRLVFVVTFLFTFGAAAAFLAVRAKLDDRYSTKSLIDTMVRESRGETLSVAFWEETPYSAFVYLGLQRGITLVKSLQKDPAWASRYVSDRNDHFIAIGRKKMKSLPLALSAKLEPVWETPSWVVLRDGAADRRRVIPSNVSPRISGPQGWRLPLPGYNLEP